MKIIYLEDLLEFATELVNKHKKKFMMSDHNTSSTAHEDIRELISGLKSRLNTLLDSDDVTLDQLSEIVAYIKSNRTLIENVTTNKVSVSDIVNNLTSTATNKTLSANQGRILKELIYTLTPDNCWYNTSNGTYKFVPIGSGFASNNKGIKSSVAESTWQGIFKQDADFVLKYKVSSEANCDKLTVTLDGTTIVNAVSGDGTEQTYTCELEAGKHTLYARYSKDGSVDSYEDRAYLEFANVMVMLEEIQYDTEPVRDSPLPITSGGVYAAIENIEAGVLNEITDDDITKIIDGTYTE